jgi:nucleotide-binding universal stress UspA family protein
MYDRILVPTDGSDEVDRALAHAAELAATHDAELVAVYVVNTASYGGLPMETSIEGITQVLETEGESALSRVREIAADRDVPVDGHLVQGTPSREIVATAEGEGCDLVVMGTHGRGGLNRLLLGSVAERVVRRSPVPVLTVRVGGDTEERSARAESVEDDTEAPPDAESSEA